jgi:leucyl-tRNA synthetase
VKDAKPRIKEELIDAGSAIVYCEPSGTVVSRSGDKCVCALSKQWYITYGEDEWRAQVHIITTTVAVSPQLTRDAVQVMAVLEDMETFGSATQHQLEQTLHWLHEWACSHSYGQGIELPWDPQRIIEPLSDSTICTAYHTVAHLLQGALDGSTTGPAGVRPEQLTNQVWDYIFARCAALPVDSTIPMETLNVLRREFQYWYVAP